MPYDVVYHSTVGSRVMNHKKKAYESTFTPNPKHQTTTPNIKPQTLLGYLAH